MQNREAEMIPRMSQIVRVAWPKRVVRKQEDVTHTRFYWLERAPETVRPDEMYTVRVEGQTVIIETPGTGSLTLRLSDALLDLDQPVRVVASARIVFEGRVSRSFAAVV
jgi:hypothetical protein